MEPAGLIEDAILIAGPTASGKSALALDLARRHGGVVVNADSMQVYGVLDVLTARPGLKETEAVPHRLYGHVHPSEDYSVGRWLDDVAGLARAGELGRRPVFVGGTGLYFRALLGGLSPMPAVPPEVSARLRALLAAEGAPALHRLLSGRDPAAAARLRPGDGQRIVRALEVLEVSGRSILQWQAGAGIPLVDPASAERLLLDPPRPEIVRRIDARLGRMVGEGAVEEVRALLSLGLAPDMPAMKAIGVRAFAAFLAGEIDLAEAVARAGAATRQYAKRQATWFRHQTGGEWQRLRGAEQAEMTAPVNLP
jgi:tRNA dimethylallyltransferase